MRKALLNQELDILAVIFQAQRRQLIANFKDDDFLSNTLLNKNIVENHINKS